MALVLLTGHHRKHARRLLRPGVSAGRSDPERRIYDQSTREALIVVWKGSDSVRWPNCDRLPPMQHSPVELDITDSASIAAAAHVLVRFPQLNVLLNNAGIMLPDTAAGVVDEMLLVSTVATSLFGPVRMTGALIAHLKRQDRATIIHMTSVLGLVPLAVTAVYPATKAALQSYALSQRYLLRDSSVAVLEIAPQWVRTELMNSSEEARAMPLDQFISGTMDALGTAAEES